MNHNDNFTDDLKVILKQKGMKFTEQRAIILDILLSIDEHLSAEEIYALIKKNYDKYKIGIATVYRTLKFLEEASLISSISFGSDGKKYERGEKSHHDHLICTRCEKIVEFFEKNIETYQEKVALKNGFEITGHSMQIYGICQECRKGDRSQNTNFDSRVSQEAL